MPQLDGEKFPYLWGPDKIGFYYTVGSSASADGAPDLFLVWGKTGENLAEAQKWPRSSPNIYLGVSTGSDDDYLPAIKEHLAKKGL